MILSSTLLTHLAAGKPVDVRWLIWARPIDRATGLRVGIGFWNGIDNDERVIASETRLYYAAPLVMPPLRTSKGLDVQTIDIGMAVTPEAEFLVRGYEPRLAPLDIHLEATDPADNSLIERSLQWRGTIDTIDLPTPALGGERMMTARCATTARRGTLTRQGFKSHATQVRRSGDRIRLHSSMGLVASDAWGVTE
jgi:hypothetical protein